MRRSVGARVSQLPSGSMPTISECACWEICRVQRLAIGGRHPVVRLDALVGIDARLKLRGAGIVLDVPVIGIGRIERLSIHGGSSLDLVGRNV